MVCMEPIQLATCLVLASPVLSPGQAPTLAELARIARELPGERALGALDRLAARARAIEGDAGLEARVSAVRCLGLLAREGRAQPEDFARLMAALEDRSRAVRWVAVTELGAVRFPAAKLAREARRSLLRCWKAWPKDLALQARVERVRDETLAELRPAAPGGAPDRDTSKHRETKQAGPTVKRHPSDANERAAIATLRNLCSAQWQIRASKQIDVDGDGAGEFGYFLELCGVMAPRGDEKGEVSSKERIKPPVLSRRFGAVQSGAVVRNGYCFRIFLPGKDGVAVPEADGGGWKGCAVAADQAESLWCAYAWPVDAGESGRRVFFIDQDGDVYGCDNAFGDYSGLRGGPGAGAARKATEQGATSLADPTADRTIGRDGHRWRVVH